MTSADNPYESPRGIDSTSGLAADRALTATFVVDEAWLSETARMLTLRQDVASGVAIAATMLSCMAVGAFATVGPSQPAAGLLVGMFVGAFGGLAVSLPLGIAFRRYNRFHKWPRYPLGICRVRIDLQVLTVTCPGDSWSYPLKSVRHAWVGDAVCFRIAKSDDRFIIRQSADFGDDDFKSWRLAVFKRIKIW